MMGLSMVSGLLCLVLMLGYGLVAIPKILFKWALPHKRLRYLQYKAAFYDHKISEKKTKLEELFNVPTFTI
jgi:hypothetical protein